MKKTILLSVFAATIFSGCFSNPFGIGHEKSSCEVSSGFGVCGEPKKIYTHRDKIKQLQSDYMKSGYDGDLYFGINDSGEMLVKDDREGRWMNYNGSRIQAEIESLLEKKDPIRMQDAKVRKASSSMITQDIPVTNENDLSVKYMLQKPVIQTRTNVGEVIRDNGLVQKIWIAPVVDSKNDLISAHEIYLVVKEPKWVVGEDTPKNMKNIGEIPTPMSEKVLEKIEVEDKHQETVVNHYNNDNKAGLSNEIKNGDSQEKKLENQEDLNLINQFLSK